MLICRNTNAEINLFDLLNLSYELGYIVMNWQLIKDTN